ncbi:MAG TPA: tyrosine-type recombinase/integrase [Nitrososphaerales archaeon]|nr:tyrosine-type recombinase/integrase [Nitrososphaerales archaeon]
MSQQTITKQLPIASELIELFIQDCKDREMTSDSIRHYKSVTSHFFTFLSNHALSPYEADKQIFIEYLRYRKAEGVCEKTLQNNFAALSTFYEFMLFQDYVVKNPMSGIRKRYLRRYKNEKDVDAESPRKLISVEQMSLLINSVLDTRDKAILGLLAKTGVRRGELIAMDVGDIDWSEQTITLKKFKKRSGRTIFFDDETGRVLKRWVSQREKMEPETSALFIGEKGGRLRRHGIYELVLKYAEQVGLHDSKSDKPEDHFTPHCFRHWFTTHLRRAGMDREFIKALRGDRRREAIDIYDRIDRQELRRAYLAFIPQLGL